MFYFIDISFAFTYVGLLLLPFFLFTFPQQFVGWLVGNSQILCVCKKKVDRFDVESIGKRKNKGILLKFLHRFDVSLSSRISNVCIPLQYNDVEI